MSPLALLESEIAKALSLFQGDTAVLEGLIRVVRCSGKEYPGYLLIKPCLRAIGALGDESGKELLEYQKDQGNVTAKAALELFGRAWEDIKYKEKEIEEISKGEIKAEVEKKELDKKEETKKSGFFKKLFS
ncbi:MAG: hypothetical protein EMLJLAPB_00155 [Candidatus Argoarchaeum ethanivorans]|uniref:Uncharacterized protein n=1 Tax=Candidatus Argoarchaeum ethanivorans TaxID=2608793 RepID=A0A811T2K1_9EURY|nr:MAG: hypothetical protein EMLJLAPB_00155 [Candidatus Argoarchaeum ethanivorans]